MAEHRTVSARSLKARTVVGGVVAGGMLLFGAPAVEALAAPTTQVVVNKTPEKELGAAIGKYLAKHPKAAVKLITFVSKLPPKTQQEIGKIAADLGLSLGGA